MPVVVHATKDIVLTRLGGSITAEMSRYRLNSCSRECNYVVHELFLLPSHLTDSSVTFLEIAPRPYLKGFPEKKWCGV